MNAGERPAHTFLLDAAAYTLGALEPDEEVKFQDHLAECAECRDEVAALERVVGALAMSPQQYAAPRALRARVVRSVTRERRAEEPRQRVPKRPMRTLFGRPAYAAAFGAVLAIAVALSVGLLQGSSGAVRQLQARVQHSSGRAELQLSRGRGTLLVRDFPPPAPGHVYEVWLQRSSGRPAPTRTLFTVTIGGAADVGLPESLHGVRRILVTQEPAGGSVVSTHAPVIVAPVT